MNGRFLRALLVNGKQTYLIVDYFYWTKNALPLKEWLNANTEDGTDTRIGLTLNFSNEQEEMMFLLKWS